MTENVLYMKPETEEGSMEENDDWDDSLLVKAYDKAVSLAKEKIAAKLASENEKEELANENGFGGRNSSPQPKITNNRRNKWKVGNICRTQYSGDGREYEAVIKNIDIVEGTCTVRYLGYGNEEEVDIKSLRASHGKEAQQAQKAAAQPEKAYDYGNYSSANGVRESPTPFHQNSGVIPPPPPPFVMANLPKDETDALSAMLMSWYMSGYHTGYYQGLTRSKMPERQCNYRNGN